MIPALESAFSRIGYRANQTVGELSKFVHPGVGVAPHPILTRTIVQAPSADALNSF